MPANSTMAAGFLAASRAVSSAGRPASATAALVAAVSAAAGAPRDMKSAATAAATPNLGTIFLSPHFCRFAQLSMLYPSCETARSALDDARPNATIARCASSDWGGRQMDQWAAPAILFGALLLASLSVLFFQDALPDSHRHA